tara:strand:+ start:2130 stop:2981 length:852 start_codon:yes stop_codon:yes gene_type:complete
MKISTFPKAKALPSSKEEKSKQAWYTSKPHLPQEVEIVTSDDLIEIVCNNAWSPSIFEGFRNQNNFKSTDFMVLDIDDGMTINEAESTVHKLDIACLCLPSTSHTEELHKFRLIFPLSRAVTNKPDFEETMRKLAEHFPADPACLGDSGRFFFGGRLVDGFWYDADLLVPSVAKKPEKTTVKPYDSKEVIVVAEDLEELVEQLYGEKRTKVPEPIAHFLGNAPDNLAGQWYHSSNSFLFTCGLLGLEQDTVTQIFFSLYPHEQLTQKMVDKMYLDGYSCREEL